jgi:dethiobiotin synthetase
MNVSKGLVIVGNDTEIGKTTIACQIINLLRDNGLKVGAFKPAASGYSDDDTDGDIRRLIDATGCDLSLDEVCPYRFKDAVAPVLAAERLNTIIDDKVIQSRLDAMIDKSDTVIVETAGGLMSPLSNSIINLDFCKATGLAALVVIENRLGAINQANLVCNALNHKNQSIAAVVFNQISADAGSASLLDSNLRMFAASYEKLFQRKRPACVSVAFNEALRPSFLAELGLLSRR